MIEPISQHDTLWRTKDGYPVELRSLPPEGRSRRRTWLVVTGDGPDSFIMLPCATKELAVEAVRRTPGYTLAELRERWAAFQPQGGDSA